jgi:LemA protein
MKTGSALLALGAGVLLAGALLLGGRHELANGRRAIDSAFSQFDAAVRAQDELLSQIVTATRANAGPAGQAQPAFDETTSALAAMAAARTPAEMIAADGPLEIALARILLIQEVHPELKTDSTALRLQTALAKAEADIAGARRKYNEAVQQYNASLAAFPQNAAAVLFGFRREENYFNAAALLR